MWKVLTFILRSSIQCITKHNSLDIIAYTMTHEIPSIKILIGCIPLGFNVSGFFILSRIPTKSQVKPCLLLAWKSRTTNQWHRHPHPQHQAPPELQCQNRGQPFLLMKECWELNHFREKYFSYTQSLSILHFKPKRLSLENPSPPLLAKRDLFFSVKKKIRQLNMNF